MNSQDSEASISKRYLRKPLHSKHRPFLMKKEEWLRMQRQEPRRQTQEPHRITPKKQNCALIKERERDVQLHSRSAMGQWLLYVMPKWDGFGECWWRKWMHFANECCGLTEFSKDGHNKTSLPSHMLFHNGDFDTPHQQEISLPLWIWVDLVITLKNRIGQKRWFAISR